MPPAIASLVIFVGIAGLFYLDRDKGARISGTLWLPAIWLFLISSRPASLWLGVSPMAAGDATQAYIEGSPFDRNIFIAMILIALGVIVARSNKLTPLLQKNAVLLLYFSFCLISIVWSD